jgi:hypothetical protein
MERREVLARLGRHLERELDRGLRELGSVDSDDHSVAGGRVDGSARHSDDRAVGVGRHAKRR